MNQKIIDYLQKNKNKYHQKDLVGELKKYGYSQSEIDDAIKMVYPHNSTEESDDTRWSTGVYVVGLMQIGLAVYMHLFGMWKYFNDSTTIHHSFFEFELFTSFVSSQVLAMTSLVMGMLLISLAGKKVKGRGIVAVMIIGLTVFVKLPVYFYVIYAMGIYEYIWPPAFLVIISVAIEISIEGMLAFWIVAKNISAKKEQISKKVNTTRKIIRISSAIGIFIIFEILVIMIISPFRLARMLQERVTSADSERTIQEIKSHQAFRRCPNFKEKVKFFDRSYPINYYLSMQGDNVNCDKAKYYIYGKTNDKVKVFLNVNSILIDGTYMDYDITKNYLLESLPVKDYNEYEFDNGKGYYIVSQKTGRKSGCQITAGYFPDNAYLVVSYRTKISAYDYNEELCQDMARGKKVVGELRNIAKKYKISKELLQKLFDNMSDEDKDRYINGDY